MLFWKKKQKSEKDSQSESISCEIDSQSGSVSYALIPVFRGKTKSRIGNQIVHIIQKSNFCSSNPLVKRLIIKNVEVCCIVVETSGAQSLKIICASVPYLVSLMSKASPKFKAMVEDERVVPYIQFFQEIDFDSLLSSLCTATIIIHNGVKKCYPIICVQLGRDALLFSKNSLRYLWHLFLEGLVYAVHYICEDLPHVLQSLCAQNYAVAKYFVQNLPIIALGGAKNFVLFTLFIQRIVNAGLKCAKRLLKLVHRVLRNISSHTDVVKIFREIFSQIKSFVIFFTSGSTYKKLKSVCIQFLNWYLSFLKQSVPLLWAEVLAFIQKSTPIVKDFIKSMLSSLPKLYQLIEENKDYVVQFYSYISDYLKILLQYTKPFCLLLFEVLQLSAKNLLELLFFILPYVKQILFRMYYDCKYWLQCNRKTINFALLRLKELYPVILELTMKGCHTLFISCKLILKFLKDALSFLTLHVQNISRDSVCFLQEFLPILKPAVWEVSSTFNSCSKEIALKSVLGIQRIAPSIWCGLKTVTPCTLRASYEIVVTTKTSACLLYPELMKTIVIISPELSKGLYVILQDSGKACMEITNVSYHATQEMLQVTKCVSKQLPIVFKAFTEVTITTSGAMSEILVTSSKAGTRVCYDLHSAVQAVNSAFNLAELELVTTVNEVALDVNSVISDCEEVREVLILFAETGRVILTVTSKQCYMTFKDLSVVSIRAVKYSYNTMQKACRHVVDVNISAIVNVLELKRTLQGILSDKSFRKFFGFRDSPASSSKSFSEEIYMVLKSAITKFNSNASDVVRQVSREFLRTVYGLTPKLWDFSKKTNANMWHRFCDSSSKLWTLLELVAASSWQLTCAYTPELWDCFKAFSFRAWELTCEISPVLWESALPVFPVLWTSQCDVVQYVWEFHLKTCNDTWKIVVPLTSASWECVLNTFPKAWFILCQNSKTQWSSLCGAVEFSWNTVTKTSSSSWKIFHKTVSNSWKHAVRPVTTSACYRASAAMAKSIKLSYSVCTKTKKMIYFT